MPQISGRTLVVVIQSVDAELRHLRETPEEESGPGDDLRLMDLVNVAEELKNLYEEACAEADNLPPYHSLVT
ncbi:hypothetical protein [Paraburkholderia kirstenboschensis]|uniref:Uncharacterized protein n=1 Tax=Paraburkholderia kirstenboschensis TaxID=1245436 RepID=A0ABZ0EAH3_9BURK|nr:hypothetical protein [Paraburkholderia kirstenboschensis]WOD14246.1 hypothetical protein RW095_01685 [Paraburkholderia kirstenboschensis]